jgi:CHASE1-domain containing sensor protein
MSTGEPTLTGRITLLQDEQQRAGFLYLLPIYRNGAAPTTQQQREEALVGLVYMRS